MYRVLLLAVLGTGLVFLGLTLVIVVGKAWREARDAWERKLRRDLEPRVLAYAHSDEPSLIAVLGRSVRRAERGVLERILLDHVQRVEGIERDRLSRALHELGFVEEYLAGLKSPRWWKRAEAAEKLGLARAARATEALIQALEDDESEVRLRAAKALGAVGGRAAVRPLLRALSEPSRWSTIRIGDILASMGEPVASELLEEFPRLSLHARIAALDILGRIRSLQAIPWLRARLADPEQDVRARAAHALGQIGDVEAGEDLLRALDDPAWPVRAMAAKSLGKLRYRRAIPKLSAALRDREWWVRANAAEALRLMGAEGIDSLERALGDDDVYARHQACLMLEEAGVVDRRVEDLVAASGPAREAAAEFVRRFVEAGQTGRLRELAERHENAAVRAALAELLSIGTEEARS
jgi:HEAT repeat protein